MSGGKPPAWVKSVKLLQELVFNTRRLFVEDTRGKGLVPWPTGIRDWTLPISGPERAIMELLNA
jgi:hypothetical protein